MSRDINFGADETDAKYQISDDGTPGDFVLARDTNGNTVLLKWSDTNSQWEYGGPVDLNGNDLEDGATTVYDASTDTVGDGTNTSADHTSVSTDEAIITDVGSIHEAGKADHGTVTAGSTSTVSVTFGTATDSSDPIVIPSVGDNGGVGDAHVMAEQISSTGFDHVVVSKDSSDRAITRSAYVVIDP